MPYIIIAVLALASFILRKLTLPAAITAAIIAALIFWGSGLTGLAMLGAFFILGVTATSWHKSDKETFKSKADQHSQRNTGQVLANGGIAAICGVLARISFLAHYHQVFCLMMAGSLAVATADTLSSELGMIYGRRFYNVVRFKPDQKGLDGVISLEGTLIGIAGSAMIALIYCLSFGSSLNFWIIVASGIVGNYMDSLLGATLERKHMLNNNMVNCLNTFTGALIAFAISNLIH